MRMIRPEQLKHLRETYPAGTRVELIQMDDVQAPPTGTFGTVIGVDDTGSLLVNWDNGSGLNVIWGVDVVRKVAQGIMSSDLISRQAAIEATWFEPSYTDPLNVLTEVRDRLKALPSAQPELRKGEWIDEGFYADGHGAHAFRCSECGGRIIEYDADPFCRWCGADMRGEQDEENKIFFG